jgi:hypothetical protein
MTGHENQMDNSLMKQRNKKWMNEHWKLATWNARGLSRKLKEVIQELGKGSHIRNKKEREMFIGTR